MHAVLEDISFTLDECASMALLGCNGMGGRFFQARSKHW